MGMSAMKIIMSIINSDPPTLSGSSFSKEFKDFVSLCLQKEPSKRPSAEKLLKHKFLQKAEDASYLVENFLSGTADLKDRVGDKLKQQGEGRSHLLSSLKLGFRVHQSPEEKAQKEKEDQEVQKVGYKANGGFSQTLCYRDTQDSKGGPWDFGSGSYGTEEAKARLKGETKKKKKNKHDKGTYSWSSFVLRRDLRGSR